jgi:hypothetical protein
MAKNYDEEIHQTFAIFGLDPTKPADYDALAKIIAKAKPRRPRGRQKGERPVWGEDSGRFNAIAKGMPEALKQLYAQNPEALPATLVDVGQMLGLEPDELKSISPSKLFVRVTEALLKDQYPRLQNLSDKSVREYRQKGAGNQKEEPVLRPDGTAIPPYKVEAPASRAPNEAEKTEAEFELHYSANRAWHLQERVITE